MSMKNPLTLAGIEPATFRFVAQHLNHCATAVSRYKKVQLVYFQSKPGIKLCDRQTDGQTERQTDRLPVGSVYSIYHSAICNCIQFFQNRNYRKSVLPCVVGALRTTNTRMSLKFKSNETTHCHISDRRILNLRSLVS